MRGPDPIPCMHDPPRLERPAIHLRSAFLAALEDYASACEREICDAYRGAAGDFGEYCELLRQNEQGNRLPDGWVPVSTFWLVDADRHIAGIIRIRHRLNAFLEEHGGHICYDVPPSRRRQGNGRRLLELGLLEAARLGLPRVLLICDDDNLPSRRIIEACGGVHLDTRQPPGERVPVRRYWIDLPTYIA